MRKIGEDVIVLRRSVTKPRIRARDRVVLALKCFERSQGALAAILAATDQVQDGAVHEAVLARAPVLAKLLA
jgi:hypothetical protein